MNYRDVILRNRLRIKTKFKYFRRGFLKNLNYTLLLFKFFRKSIRVLSFKRRESLGAPLSLGYISFRRKRRVFFRSSKILGLLKINILCTNFSGLSGICTSVYRICPYLNIYKQSKLFQLPTIATNKRLAFYNSKVFLRTNNLQFVIKKKLNLRKQKVFFYSVHIAAPKKKTKKWSLFALKNIYYKKVSLFFGFRKVIDFFKIYNLARKLSKANVFAVFLMLEGRLDNFLMRLNLFPSVYFIKKFIEHGNVFVNNKTINYAAYNLSFNEVVSFIKFQLKQRKIIINLPPFIEADYKLLVAMLIRNPDEFSLTKPLSFNLYTKFLSLSK